MLKLRRFLLIAVLMGIVGLVVGGGCGGGGHGSRVYGTGTGTNSSTGTGSGSTNPSNGSGGTLGDSTQTLGGVSGCLVHTPSTYAHGGACVKLLMTSHGNGGSPSDMMPYWTPVADAKHFIVCSVPHGIIDSTGAITTAGGQFVSARDDMFTKYNIDKNAVYANGFSGGGQVAFWAVLETAGWAGNMCFSSTIGSTANPLPKASGELPIYWKNCEDDPFFAWSMVQPNYDAVVAGGHNVHGHDIWPAGSSHSMGIQNCTEAWDWTTNPANKP